MNMNDGTLKLWHIHAAGGTVVLGLTALAYVAIVRPIGEKQASLEHMRSEVHAQTQQMTLLDSQRFGLETDLLRFKRKLESSPVQLQSADHLNERLARLVQLSAASNMLILESKSGEVTPGEWYQIVPLEMSARGSFANCASFLHLLSENLPDIEVLTFELESSPSDPGALATFHFDFAWYASASVAAATDER